MDTPHDEGNASDQLSRRAANILVHTITKRRVPQFSRLARVGLAVIGLACFVGLCPAGSKAQPSVSPQEDSFVLVKSWKTGSGQVAEQVLNLHLLSKVPQYIFDVESADKQYQLRLIQRVENTVRTPGLPCWIADFREVTQDKSSSGKRLGYHLLSVEGPGMGHYFPREEWAGHFCPVEKPNEVLDGQFYPIATERRFLIEKFLIIMQVTDYQYDVEKSILRELDLRIEFRNRNSNPLLVPKTSVNLRNRSSAKRN